jgi:signal transduction histidine kinase
VRRTTKFSAERRIAVEQSVLLAIALTAAAVLSDSDQWDHPALLTLLLAAALSSDRITVGLGSLRVSMVDIVCALAAALAGPAPAAVIVVIVMTIDAVSSRVPLHGAIANVSYLTATTVACGSAIESLVDAGTIVPGEGSFAVAVLVATVCTKCINLAVLLYTRSIAGYPWRQELRESTIPILPWDAVGIFVAAGTAHAYQTIGIEAIVVLIVVLYLFRALLQNIANAEQRAREIARIAADRDRYMQEALAAEERERRRLAAELHDDALQTLLSARADLVEGLSGDETRLVTAHDAVASAVSKLRDLMVRLGPTSSPGPIGPTVRGLADRMGRRAGFEPHVDVASDIEQLDDQLVFHVARELLNNVAKHAHATHVEVRAWCEDGNVVLEVTDDGVGFDGVDRLEVLESGHIGLALLEQRVATRGGTLDIGSGPAGGTQARAVVPVAEGAMVGA